MKDENVTEKYKWLTLLLTSSVVSIAIGSLATLFTQTYLQKKLYSQEKIKAFIYDYPGIKQKVINTRSRFFNVTNALSEAIDLNVKREAISESLSNRFRQGYYDFLISLEALRLFVKCYGEQIDKQTHGEICNVLERIKDLLIDGGIEDVTEHLNPLYGELQFKMPNLLKEADESILQKIEDFK